jgi:hypothetical protein
MLLQNNFGQTDSKTTTVYTRTIYKTIKTEKQPTIAVTIGLGTRVCYCIVS